MSDRKTEQKTLLQISHERQIEALLNEDIDGWVDAVALNEGPQTIEAMRDFYRTGVKEGVSVACIAWYSGHYPYSLFACLPKCGCPVQERRAGNMREEQLIPRVIRANWKPRRKVLEAFARIQQAHRQ